MERYTYTLAEGAHDGIPARDYHAMHGSLSSTGIKQLLRSPAHYRHWLSRPDEPTPAMRFGTHAHTMLLEPHLPRPVVRPKFDRRTKIGKADAEAWESANEGREWIDAGDMSCLAGCVSAFARAGAFARSGGSPGGSLVVLWWFGSGSRTGPVRLPDGGGPAPGRVVVRIPDGSGSRTGPAPGRVPVCVTDGSGSSIRAAATASPVRLADGLLAEEAADSED